MKTLQELYDAIMGSDELKDGIGKAVKDGKLEEFLKAQGCDATLAEFETFINEKAAQIQEMSDEELKKVAGGTVGVLEPRISSIMPWTCNPSYSSMIDEDGKFNPILICA